MRSPVWTVDEIHALPRFGAGNGWFYGLVRHEGRLHFGEVFPGCGYANPWPMWHPRSWWWAARDVYRALFRAPFVMTPEIRARIEQADAELEEEIRNAKPWDLAEFEGDG